MKRIEHARVSEVNRNKNGAWRVKSLQWNPHHVKKMDGMDTRLQEHRSSRFINPWTWASRAEHCLGQSSNIWVQIRIDAVILGRLKTPRPGTLVVTQRLASQKRRHSGIGKGKFAHLAGPVCRDPAKRLWKTTALNAMEVRKITKPLTALT